MLPDPPCIDLLYGCSDTDIGGDTSTSRSSSYSSERSSSSSSSFSSTSSSGGPFTSRYSSQSVRLSAYTVTASNRGTETVTGLAFLHGPIPSGAEFDASRSSPECVQSETFIQCTVNLEPGESKNFDITYRVNNATSCALARPLQSVSVMGQSTETQVALSVACVMKSEAGLQGSSASSSFSSSSSSSSSVVSVVVDEQLTHAAGTADTTKAVTDTKAGVIGYKDEDLGKGKGGKGYKPYPKPRAGAVSDYFTRVTQGSLLTPVKSPSEIQSFTAPLWTLALPILAVAIIAVVTLLYRRRMSHSAA